MSTDDKHDEPPDLLAGAADVSVPDGPEPLPPSMAVRVWRFIVKVITAYDRDDVPLLSAAIAFYGLLAIAPILVIAVAIADAVAAGDRVRRDIIVWVGQHVGSGVGALLDEWIQNYRDSEESRFALYVSIVVLIVSASRLFAHIRTALDRIWHIRSAPPLSIPQALWTRLMGLGIVGLLGLLLLTSLGVKIVLRTVVQRTGLSGMPLLWVSIDWVLYFVLVGGIIYVMYRRLPHAVVPPLHARRGAALTAILLIAGGEVIAYYIARPGVTTGYGAAGSTMALVLWVYYATQVFLIGAIVTWVFAQKDAKLRRRRKLRLRRKKVAKAKRDPDDDDSEASADDTVRDDSLDTVRDDDAVQSESDDTPVDATVRDDSDAGEPALR